MFDETLNNEPSEVTTNSETWNISQQQKNQWNNAIQYELAEFFEQEEVTSSSSADSQLTDILYSNEPQVVASNQDGMQNYSCQFGQISPAYSNGSNNEMYQMPFNDQSGQIAPNGVSHESYQTFPQQQNSYQYQSEPTAFVNEVPFESDQLRLHVQNDEYPGIGAMVNLIRENNAWKCLQVVPDLTPPYEKETAKQSTKPKYINTPYQQRETTKKAPKPKNVKERFRDLNLYLDVIKNGHYDLFFNHKYHQVHFVDIKNHTRTGNFLMLVQQLMKQCLDGRLSDYTLTGQRQLKSSSDGRCSKVKAAAKKFPEELKQNIKQFVIDTRLLINHPELLDIFDAYMNTVFTKAFNREQDKERKQREAAAKRAAQKLN